MAAPNWLDPAFIAQLCGGGITPHNMSQLVMRVLLSHFSTPADYFNAELAHLYVGEPQSAGTLRIQTTSSIKLDIAEKYPVILVKRGAQQFGRLVMGDNGSQTNRSLSYYSYIRRVKGEHQIHIVSAVDGETENLAMEVLDALTARSPIIVDQYPIDDFQVMGMSELTQITELGNRFGITVSVQYDYTYSWGTNIGDEIAPPATGTNLNMTFGS